MATSLTIYEESQAIFNMRERTRANVRFAERERPRHHQVRWLGFRQQTLAMDALPARSGGGAAAWQAGQARAQPQDDVPDRPVIARARSSVCGSAPHRKASSSRSSTTTFTTRSMLDDYHENCGEATAFHYSVPNLRVKFGRARRNIGTPSDMRGPGAVPGLYATESAMNELADQLKIDPVRASRAQRAEDRRVVGHSIFIASLSRVPRARRGKVRLVEAQSRSRLDEARRIDRSAGEWPGPRGSPRDLPPRPMSQLRDDGTARVACGTQDIGTGTYTILAQLACGEDRCATRQSRSGAWRYDASAKVRLSGGSMATGSVVPAVFAAADNAIAVAADRSRRPRRDRPSRSASPKNLAFEGGRVFVKAEWSWRRRSVRGFA